MGEGDKRKSERERQKKIDAMLRYDIYIKEKPHSCQCKRKEKKCFPDSTKSFSHNSPRVRHNYPSDFVICFSFLLTPPLLGWAMKLETTARREREEAKMGGIRDNERK